METLYIDGGCSNNNQKDILQRFCPIDYIYFLCSDLKFLTALLFAKDAITRQRRKKKSLKIYFLK